jgi:hypothetical protein
LRSCAPKRQRPSAQSNQGGIGRLGVGGERR